MLDDDDWSISMGREVGGDRCEEEEDDRKRSSIYYRGIMFIMFSTGRGRYVNRNVIKIII